MRLFASMLLALGFALAGIAVASNPTASGRFVGASGHETRGVAEIVETADGYAVRLGADFFFDGAPDPRVGLGKSGRFDAATDAGALRSNRGGQLYPLPASVNPEDFDEIYIWCRRFAVPLGVARLD